MSLKNQKIEAGYKVFRNSDFPSDNKLSSMWYPSKPTETKQVAEMLRAQGFKACVVKEKTGYAIGRTSSREYATYRYLVMYKA